MLVEEKGKQVPKKVGLAPEQREGVEYEFSLVLDLAMNHSAESSKDRTSLFDGQIFTPSMDTGKKLMDWLQSARPREARRVTAEDRDKILKIAQFNGWKNEETADHFQKHYPARKSLIDLNWDQYEEFRNHIETHPKTMDGGGQSNGKETEARL